MGWFCDTYSRLKAENEELRKQVSELEIWVKNAREDKENTQHTVDIYTKRLTTELDTLRLQVQLYDRLMKGLRINVNLDGKKK
jgi:hypothetical protein